MPDNHPGSLTVRGCNLPVECHQHLGNVMERGHAVRAVSPLAQYYLVYLHRSVPMWKCVCLPGVTVDKLINLLIILTRLSLQPRLIYSVPAPLKALQATLFSVGSVTLNVTIGKVSLAQGSCFPFNNWQEKSTTDICSTDASAICAPAVLGARWSENSHHDICSVMITNF